jgi:hypothetical protein
MDRPMVEQKSPVFPKKRQAAAKSIWMSATRSARVLPPKLARTAMASGADGAVAIDLDGGVAAVTMMCSPILIDLHGVRPGRCHRPIAGSRSPCRGLRPGGWADNIDRVEREMAGS